MKAEEILTECRALVEQICANFGYSDQDSEGNDSLKTVLLKLIPAMLKDSNQKDRELFYQMLSHTPIVVVEEITQQIYDDLLEQHIGKNHIIEEDANLGEYGKGLGAGAYVSEAILDENMHLQGKKSFIYIQKVTGVSKEFLGTDINVAHLIHELGHAWNAEKEEFAMQPDGTLKQRVGTAEFIFSFTQTPDGKVVKKCVNATGIMIEESMNTIAEELAMANYMGISLEEMQNEYKESLVPSEYQGYMANLVSYMLKKLGTDNFKNYRLYGEEEGKNEINSLMENTEYWKNKETDILPSSDSPRNYENKRAVLARISSSKAQKFFKEYESLYFPDISTMTPLEKIDNVLAQKYNMNLIRYHMGIDIYKAFLEILRSEGYSLINEAATTMSKKGPNAATIITPESTVQNALKQGITAAMSSEARLAEQPELNNQIQVVGET